MNKQTLLGLLFLITTVAIVVYLVNNANSWTDWLIGFVVWVVAGVVEAKILGE